MGDVKIKASKKIAELKKGDNIKVDALKLEVDAHEVMIEHEGTKEMSLELFDPKSDKDYQLRYFNDNMENTLEFYELKEIVYDRVDIKKVEW
jgi:hypothetical protein